MSVRECRSSTVLNAFSHALRTLEFGFVKFCQHTGGNASLWFTCSHWAHWAHWVGDHGAEFQTKARPRGAIESIERNQCFHRVPGGFNCCTNSFPADSDWFRLIQTDSDWFRLIQTDSDWFRLICTNSFYDLSCLWGNCAPWEQFLGFCSNLVHRELLWGDESTRA